MTEVVIVIVFAVLVLSMVWRNGRQGKVGHNPPPEVISQPNNPTPAPPPKQY